MPTAQPGQCPHLKKQPHEYKSELGSALVGALTLLSADNRRDDSITAQKHLQGETQHVRRDFSLVHKGINKRLGDKTRGAKIKE